ncbi:MAG: FAD-dependent oxidoreductase [Chloroflexota bacterium]|nr:MAG: FAD-dependent oxidoreductase [Chloroflexota bacterium]
MPKVTDSITIGTMRVKNRLFALPMISNFADARGYPTRRMIEVYRRRARAGYGLVYVEASFLRQDGKIFYGMPGIHEDHLIPYHDELTDTIHEGGAKCALQIAHMGKYVNPLVSGMQPIGPSTKNAFPGLTPRVLTTAECEELIAQYGEAAARVKACGYDAVLLHATHSFLLAQFMSPHSNDRTDRFGDPTVFIGEVIKKCKETCGAAYPVLIRMTVEEHLPDGINLELNRRLVPAVVAAGADGIETSNGAMETVEYNLEPIYRRPGGSVDELASIKEFSAVPIGVRGRINDPRLVTKILEGGRADWVGLGRQVLADPEFAQKMFEGRYDEIRKCIFCDTGCTQRDFANLQIKCSTNYSFGKEHIEPQGVAPAKTSRQVLVVGGGPGGMECARVLAERGHKVTLCEKKGTLGGMVNVAASTPHLNTGDLRNIIEWLPRQLDKLGVEVKLNTEVTPGVVETLKPDVVVLAAGSHLSVPDIEGATGANVVSVEDYYLGKKPVGNTVVVLGGQEGAEAAVSLAREGKKVTLVSETATYADGPYLYMVRTKVLAQYLAETEAQVITEAQIKRITAEGVVIAEKTGEQRTLHAETILLAMGRTPNRELAASLNGGLRTYEIGDCVSPRRIQEAIHEANAVARLI